MNAEKGKFIFWIAVWAFSIFASVTVRDVDSGKYFVLMFLSLAVLHLMKNPFTEL